MNDIASVFAAIVQILQTEFTIYDLTFSPWQVFLWSIVIGAILYLIWRWLSD